MANIKSQKKRILITAEENKRNSAIRSRVRNAVKKYNLAISNKDIELAEQLLPVTISIIDRAKSDGVYHKNSAARKISHLNKALNNIK